jgi:serine protease Do
MTVRRVSNLAISLLLALPVGLRAAGPDSLSGEVQAVFQRCAPAVVKIEAEDDDGPLSGTGFFVDPNGTIFTNFSVGGESRDIVISYGGVRYLATRVAGDSRSGLAILKLGPPNVGADPRGGLAQLNLGPPNLLPLGEAPAELHANVLEKTPFLPLGKAADLAVASLVMTIGYPLNLPETPNVGCVGGFGISDGNRYFAVTHIRASVPAQRGEGGAPLLDMNGQVVGVLESSLDGGAGCFALPIEAAEKVQSDVVSFGEARPGWLGVRFNQSDASGPIMVQGCIDNSPAEKAGVQAGDVIEKVDGRQISSLEDVLDASFYLTVGEQVPLTVLRGDKTIELNVVPEPNPTAPQLVPVWNFTFKLGP